MTNPLKPNKRAMDYFSIF